MALSGAIHWWEEWQLRILVLGSLLVQWILFLSSFLRRYAIPSWIRSIIWLAYLGSDALAIYALATLFNRQSKLQDRILEVVWAPVLLMHLGGLDTITAYNMEDNELWRRHVVTAVSQITVAIYVFGKSWTGDDKRLLQAAILLFVIGVLKCLEKPWALKSASINSLVSSSEPAQRTVNREGHINSLEDFVRVARSFVREERLRAQNEGEIGRSSDYERGARGSSSINDEDHPRHAQGATALGNADKCQTSRLFVDLASPYPDRLSILKPLWVLDEEKAPLSLQEHLSDVFSLLYTKEKTFSVSKLEETSESGDGSSWASLIRIGCMVLPFAAIGLFHHCHREAYSDADVKITYALFCCTAVMESYSIVANSKRLPNIVSLFPAIVWQYVLMGFFARNKKHAKMMCIVSFFGCKDYLDQLWCMKSCSSSYRITVLVLRYLKEGWRGYVQDAASYRMFNDHRGQWALERNGCNYLGWSLNCPFDESVLLWHIATDLCFFSGAFPGHRCAFSKVKSTWQILMEPNSARSRSLPSPRTSSQCGELTCCRAVQCRQLSNYMMYLLFVNPEMLLPGSRRNLFTTAYNELNGIVEEDNEPAPTGSARTRQGNNTPVEEKEITEKIIAKLRLQSTQGSQKEGFIHDAWSLSQELLALGDEDKMWKVIEGVWVEMLCFSAGRCRGYLHAKALGTGGELLTYVWLLMSYMGMETLAERLQRRELPSGGGNAAAAPSTSVLPNGASAASSSEVRTDTAPSTSRFPTGAAARSSDSEAPIATGAAPSTPEIRMTTEADMV